MSKSPRASSARRRMNMQKPTPVGSSAYCGAGLAASTLASGAASASSGNGEGSQKRGKEQISALLDHGVIVAIRGSDCAQASIASNQPGVATVSELSRITSSGAV